MSRKSQVSMEFLMTYGWAILAVLVVLGVLFFSSGITDTTLFLPEECEFYITVICFDHLVKQDEIQLSIVNAGDRELIVENIIATSDALNGQCELAGLHRGKRLKDGEKFVFDLNLTNAATIGLSAPNPTTNDWSLPANSQILLAQAHNEDSSNQHGQAHQLYSALQGSSDSLFADYDIESEYVLWWDWNKSKFKGSTHYRDNSPPIDTSDLTSYKSDILKWFYEVIADSNATIHAAEFVDSAANYSNYSVTAEYVKGVAIGVAEGLSSAATDGYGGCKILFDNYYSDPVLKEYLDRYRIDTIPSEDCNNFKLAVQKVINDINAFDPTLSREEVADEIAESVGRNLGNFDVFREQRVLGAKTIQNYTNAFIDGTTDLARGFPVLAFPIEVSGYPYGAAYEGYYIVDDNSAGDCFETVDINPLLDASGKPIPDPLCLAIELTSGMSSILGTDGSYDEYSSVDETWGLDSGPGIAASIAGCAITKNLARRFQSGGYGKDNPRPSIDSFPHPGPGDYSNNDEYVETIDSGDQLISHIRDISNQIMATVNYAADNPDRITPGRPLPTIQNVPCESPVYPDLEDPHRGLLDIFNLPENEGALRLTYDDIGSAVAELVKMESNAEERERKAKEIKAAVNFTIAKTIANAGWKNVRPVSQHLLVNVAQDLFSGYEDRNSIEAQLRNSIQYLVWSMYDVQSYREDGLYFTLADPPFIIADSTDYKRAFNILVDDYIENGGALERLMSANITSISKAANDSLPDAGTIKRATKTAFEDPMSSYEEYKGRVSATEVITFPEYESIAFDKAGPISTAADHVEDSAPYVDALDPINAMAQTIIGSARKDRDAANAILQFLLGWKTSRQPTITIDILEPYTESIGTYSVPSLVFKVKVYAEDDDLLTSSDITLTALKEANEQILREVIQIREDSSCGYDAQSEIHSCFVIVNINAIAYPNELIILKAGVEDKDNPGDVIYVEKKIMLPNHVPPVIEHFELISLTPIPAEGSRPYQTELVVNVTAVDDPANENLQEIQITSPESAITFEDYVQNSQPFIRTCGTDLGTCTRQFKLNVPETDGALPPKELTDLKIKLTARAKDSTGYSESDFYVRIPAKSILGCQHIDLGTKRNSYDLKFIYAWANSPNINHVITGKLVANSPD